MPRVKPAIESESKSQAALTTATALLGKDPEGGRKCFSSSVATSLVLTLVPLLSRTAPGSNQGEAAV